MRAYFLLGLLSVESSGSEVKFNSRQSSRYYEGNWPLQKWSPSVTWLANNQPYSVKADGTTELVTRVDPRASIADTMTHKNTSKDAGKTIWTEKEVENFLAPFTRREKVTQFYPRSMLTDQDVVFDILESENLKKIRDLCKFVKNTHVETADNQLLRMLETHRWNLKNMRRVQPQIAPEEMNLTAVGRDTGFAVQTIDGHTVDTGEMVVFHYMPLFAGPILSGECADSKQAYDLMLQVVWEELQTDRYRDAHGHNYMSLMSTDKVHELIFQSNRDFFQTNTHYPGVGNSPKHADAAYFLQQITALVRFWRPTLQYCQVITPLLTAEPYKQLPSSTSNNFIWEKYAADRPIPYLFVEDIIENTQPDEFGKVTGNPKYKTRRRFVNSVIDLKEKTDVLAALITDNTTLKFSECTDKARGGVCAVSCEKEKDPRACLHAYRLKKLAASQFYVYTRGSSPHEESLYDAIATNTLIVNTVDKSIDRGLPFQCQVPWEQMTIRVPTLEFMKDPVKAVKEATQKLTAEEKTKKLRLMAYFAKDLIPNIGKIQQEPATTATETATTETAKTEAGELDSFLVDDIMMNGMRRCLCEQILQRQDLTAMGMYCPFTDYTVPAVYARTVVNVDPTPWDFM